MTPIERLSANLLDCKQDPELAARVFLDHVRTGYLSGFIRSQLASLEADPHYFVRNNVAQSNFCFINTPDYEYSARLVLPFAARPHMVQWQGLHQILHFTVPGSCTVRILRVPNATDINAFAAGAELKETRTIQVSGTPIAEHIQPDEVLDFAAVQEPVIIEMLTIRNHSAGLLWTFDPTMMSTYCENSSVRASRVDNVLELSRALNRCVPMAIYERALTDGNPEIRLAAIRSMLLEEKPEGFRALHDAMESPDVTISRHAEVLLNAMLSEGTRNAD